ncbi:MAG: hypothetical protein KGL39_27140 [Patescibacteria group bacterium]|nr:hypothetical protein [Patescibacteria group bacterium]
MAANRNLLIRGIVLSAVRAAGDGQQLKPVAILENVVIGKFNTEFSNGKVLVSTNEAGGSVSFMVPGDFGPDEVMALAYEAIQRIKSGDFGPNEDSPDPYFNLRRIKRLRISFAKATI